MTLLTDDALRDLLTETFRAHETLADPDRAVAIAAAPRHPRRTGRLLVAAAAAVALVAGGTTYTRSMQPDGTHPATSTHPSVSPQPVHQPPLPPLLTDAANRAYTRGLVRRLVTRLLAAAPPGARRVTATEVTPLRRLTTYSGSFGGPHAVNASLYWLVPGDAKTVARWYVANPLRGYRADGAGPGEGPDGGIGGSSLANGGWSYDTDFYVPSETSVQGSGSIQVQTTQLGTQTGVRATVFGEWYPARPLASFVQDVTSIDVRIVHQRLVPRGPTKRRSFTLTNRPLVLRAATAYNALPGTTSHTMLGCPMMRTSDVYRVVFHTKTGDVSLTWNTGNCDDGAIVRRDGQRVGPLLGSAHSLVAELGRQQR
jgi:hypothetical protein